MWLSERYERGLEALRNAVMHSPGATSPSLREQVAARVMELGGEPRTEGEPLPSQLADFVDKIARNSHLITDEDFDALRRDGYSEDALLEIVLAATLGAGEARLNRALRALGWETGHET